MGDIAPSKMPAGVRKARRDDTDFTQYAEGGPVGLYANINAKRKRGDKMRKPGQKVLRLHRHSLILQRLRENNGNKVWLFIQIGFFAELGV